MQNLLLAIAFLVIYIYPLRWAASYSEAEDTSYASCFILSIVSTLIRFVISGFFPYSFFMQVIISGVISVILCMKVLKIPSENFLMFAITLLASNIVIGFMITLIIKGILNS